MICLMWNRLVILLPAGVNLISPMSSIYLDKT